MGPPKPIQRRPKRRKRPRAQSSDQGDVPERRKLRSSNPIGLRPPRRQPLMKTRRLRRLLKPKLLPPKSTKANSPLARCAAIATKLTSSSLHPSRVWSAGEVPRTPTICGSLSPGRWGARSATSSRYLCAEPTTATTIAPETKSRGGRGGLLIPLRRRGCFGFRPGASSNDRACGSTVRSRIGADSSR